MLSVSKRKIVYNFELNQTLLPQYNNDRITAIFICRGLRAPNYI